MVLGRRTHYKGKRIPDHSQQLNDEADQCQDQTVQLQSAQRLSQHWPHMPTMPFAVTLLPAHFAS